MAAIRTSGLWPLASGLWPRHTEAVVDCRDALYEMVRRGAMLQAMAPPGKRTMARKRCGTSCRSSGPRTTAAGRPDRDRSGLATPPPLFAVFGSATHHDVAQYVRHELRSVAVCTNIAGNGTWYVYDRNTHRWNLGPGPQNLRPCGHPEGADVLVRWPGGGGAAARSPPAR